MLTEIQPQQQRRRCEKIVKDSTDSKPEDAVVVPPPFEGFPTELLAIIVGHIRGRRNLLALALSNRKLYELVGRERLLYAELRWMFHTASSGRLDPRIASMVNSLELVYRSKTAGAPVIQALPTLPATPRASWLWGNMSNLITLKVRSRTPLPGKIQAFDVPDTPALDSKAWIGVMDACPLLEELDFEGEIPCPRCLQSSNPSEIWNFQGLRTLRLRFHCLSSSDRHAFDPSCLHQMLLASPKLEVLSLTWMGEPSWKTVLLPDFVGLRFPELRELALIRLRMGPTADQALAFLQDHPKLVRLELSNDTPTKPIGTGLPSGLLPKLRELRCEGTFGLQLATSKHRGHFRPISRLGIPCSAPAAALDGLGTTLRDLCVAMTAPGSTPWKTWVDSVAAACPSLQQLTFSRMTRPKAFIDPSSGVKEPQGEVTIQTLRTRMWMAPLTGLNHLETLGLPPDAFESIFSKDPEWFKFVAPDTVSAFREACPSLRFLVDLGIDYRVLAICGKDEDIRRRDGEGQALAQGVVEELKWTVWDELRGEPCLALAVSKV